MDKSSTTVDVIAKTCIAVRLRSLNRVVTNIYDAALRPLGLKISQLNILVVTAKQITEQDRLALNGTAGKVINIVTKAGFNRVGFITEVRRALSPT